MEFLSKGTGHQKISAFFFKEFASSILKMLNRQLAEGKQLLNLVVCSLVGPGFKMS